MELTIQQALQRAVEAHKAGNLQDAESLYRAILQAQPNHPDANHNLGVLAVSVNKAEAALPLFKIALEANPSQGQFWLSYIDTLIKEKQFDNARSLLDQGKKSGLESQKVDVLEAQLVQLGIKLKSQKSETNKFSKAIELREKGRYQEAQDWLTKFLEVEPDEAEGWSLLSQIFLLDKKDAQAEKALSNAILINANLPSIYRNQARLLLKHSKPAEALLKAQFGCEKSTEDPESWHVLASCLGANGRLNDAAKSYKRAIALKPDYAPAYNNLGNILLEFGRLEDAEKSFKKAILIKPDLAEAHSNLGNVLKAFARLEDAEMSYRKAVELKPDLVSASAELGKLLIQKNQHKDGLIFIRKACGYICFDVVNGVSIN